MARVTFDMAFARLLDHEGEYSNNPNDPGGETKYGVSKRSYPHLDIKNLTKEAAAEIYRNDFWRPCGVGLHDSVAYQVSDAAYHHGIGNAIRMLQRAIGVADDGHWGPVSTNAYRQLTENDALLLFLAERLEFMCKLQKFLNFGRGWARRIARNLRYAAQDN